MCTSQFSLKLSIFLYNTFQNPGKNDRLDAMICNLFGFPFFCLSGGTLSEARAREDVCVLEVTSLYISDF